MNEVKEYLPITLIYLSELLARSAMGPDMAVGGEPWHRALPSDWVPIIARDIQRQAEQEDQVRQDESRETIFRVFLNDYIVLSTLLF